MASTGEFFSKIIEGIAASYLEELSKTWGAFISTLGEIWSFSWSDLFYLAFPVGVAVPIIDRAIQTVDALREFSQDMRLIPIRIAAQVADDAIPVPDSFKGRVVRADQMLRFVVTELIAAGANIADADLPAEIDAVKLAEKYFKGKDLLANWDIEKALASAKKSIYFKLAIAVGNIVKWIIAFSCVLLAGWIVWRVHQPGEGEKILEERALPQDSKRIRTRRPAGVQVRVNKRAGRDT